MNAKGLLQLCLAGTILPAALFAQVPEDKAGEVFIKVYPSMESALDLVDEQKDLPDSSWLGADKKSHQKDINELLDDAIAALELDEVRRYREEIRETQEKIKASQDRIAQYRRDKLRAPKDRTLGMDQLPFFVTKGGYDEKIKQEEDDIRRYRKIINETKKDFLKRLKELNIAISDEEFEILMHTVNGEEFVDLKVAFETVKGITLQLEKLTQESGEDVHSAKKYFGLYTVLLRILDRTQRTFAEDIHKEHIPKLREYAEAARRNIAEAESAIEQGGNRILLQQNIESNRLTLQALDLYLEYLRTQEASVKELNDALQSEIITADNTYNTVALATKVVDLLRTGMKNFELLLKLEAPSIAGFENQALREEIIKLTGLMQDDT